MYGTPRAGQPQRVENESWPPKDVVGRIRNHASIPVTVRLVWEYDGEERLAGTATRWHERCVYVEIRDTRLRTTGVWVDAGDVQRR